MINEILTHTNRYYNECTANWNEKNQKCFNAISKEEMLSFIGILFAAGRNRSNKMHLDEFWSEREMFRQPLFTAAMSKDRLKLVNRYIRFDDHSDRLQRIEETNDKLQAI